MAAAATAPTENKEAPIPLTKVFVGNLSFKTKQEELAAEFCTAGKVKNANIITRGPRSLGYGFVEMETEDDAKKAVELMNKKQIDGREINVELAKPRDENAANSPPKLRANLPRRGRGGPPGRGGRGRGRVSASYNGNMANNGPEGATGGEAGRGMRRRFRGGFRARRGGAPGVGVGPKSPSPARTPSQTVLFVANLPFSVDDARLEEIFKSKNLKLKSAHVVRKKNGRSKGFGFVEFDSEADQQAALKAIDKLVVEERELIVKVALTESKDGDSAEGEKEQKNDTPAEQPKA